MKSYYVVFGGGIHQVFPCEKNYHEQLDDIGVNEDNSYEWVIAYAEDEEEALKISESFDDHMIEMGNIWCQKCGVAHVGAEFKN